MNLDKYHVFFTVAIRGSLSKAADELYVTQPAISHAIKTLEGKLGTPLFLRSSKGVKLTQEGDLLFRYVEQAFNFLTLGEQKLADTLKMVEGEVHVVASETLCKHFLLPKITMLKEAHPQIKIHVTNRPTKETVQFVREGKADLGLAFLPVEHPDLETHELLAIQDCFVVGETLKYLSLAPIAIEDLRRFPLIMLEQNSKSREQLTSFFASLGVTVSPEIELSSLDLIREFVKHGFGIGTVIRNFVESDLSEGSLFELKTTPELPNRKLGIIVSKDFPISRASKELMKVMSTS